jgi:hypothetical protein
MAVFDFALNFLIDGKQGNKIRLSDQHRPIFDGITLKQTGSKGMAILQHQISLK